MKARRLCDVHGTQNTAAAHELLCTSSWCSLFLGPAPTLPTVDVVEAAMLPQKEVLQWSVTEKELGLLSLVPSVLQLEHTFTHTWLLKWVLRSKPWSSCPHSSHYPVVPSPQASTSCFP